MAKFMSKPQKRLGILAGMGPGSTAPFLDLVYAECRRQYGARHDIDYPEIVIFSWPTPFYVDRAVDEVELKHAILSGLKELAKTDVSVIAMPCNTAHNYFDELRTHVACKLLNIIAETSAAIPAKSETVSLFATPTTMQAGLYQRLFQKRRLQFVFRREWQNEVNAIITLIKSKETNGSPATRMTSLLDDAARNGVDTVVLACTELATLGADEFPSIQIVDSSRMLAQALIREYLGD